MTPSRIALSALLLAAPAAAAPLSAQDAGLTVELHAGLALPQGDFEGGSGVGEGTSAGSTLGAAFVLPGAGRRGIYVGFSQHRFGCEDAGCGADGRYVATGFDAGLRFKLLRTGPATPWIRIGAITTRVETDDLGGANAGVSKLGLGGEVGAGVYVGNEASIALNPGVRYGFVSTELPGGEDLTLRYLVAQVALVFAF